MGYKKSEATRQKIIDESRTLFYEKGYTDTHYDDIAEKTFLSQGLIHYHFKKKDAIAASISLQIGVDILDLAKNLFGDNYEYIIVKGVAFRIQWHLFFSNENYRRFYAEICSERIPIYHGEENFNSYFEYENDKYQLGKTYQEIRLTSRLTSAVFSELVLCVGNKDIDLDEISVADTEIKLVYSMMGFPDKIINEVISESKRLFDTTNISMEKDFLIVSR